MVSMAPMDTPGRPAGRPVCHPHSGHSLDDQTIGQSDRIDCGPGNDVVFADAIDVIVDGCESVRR